LVTLEAQDIASSFLPMHCKDFEMGREISFFVGTFTMLLAIINPLEALPVDLKLLAGQDEAAHRAVAWKSCVYALLLCFFSSPSGRCSSACSAFR
jgi:MarC family integral membrane protein